MANSKNVERIGLGLQTTLWFSDMYRKQKKFKTKRQKKGMGGGDQGAISSNPGNTEWGWHPHDTPSVLRNMNLRPPIT